MMTIRATKPHDLDPSVYERAAGMKDELFKVARGEVATTAEILELYAAEALIDPYVHESERWFEPRDAVGFITPPFCGDKVEIYENFLTYVAECCDDEDVAMIAGVLCRMKEKK